MPRLLRWSTVRSRWRPLLFVFLALALESLHHQYSNHVSRPSEPLDLPFQVGCREPPSSPTRENATIMMLTRNEDLESAISSIQSLEKHFNQWFHYPIVFLNDGEFSQEFVEKMRGVVSGEAKFEVLPRDMFGFPEWMDEREAKKSIQEQGEKGIYRGEMESYHHMCRFYSGEFYDVPALQPYKYYWRVEPHVQFSCSITYDPFAMMSRHGKVYGYTVALWEVDNTVPSLFRAISDFKTKYKIPTTDTWRSMIKPSLFPLPFRWLLGHMPWRNADGDLWNLCHFWSNFEIADLDFYRSPAYRELFSYLDQTGGFYHERWGDASVHSLAAALLLPPEKLHHFHDFGYGHAPWRVCPANAKGAQLPDSRVLGAGAEWTKEQDGGVGCRCECKPGRNHQSYCLNKVQKGVNLMPWPNIVTP